MKKLVACMAVAAIGLAAAGSAEAKAPAKGSLKLYGIYVPTSEDYAIPFGQLDSSKACEGGRKFELVAVHRGFKPTLIDEGTTSRDGGVSAMVKGRDTVGADDAVFVFAKTKKCAKVTYSLRKLGREAAESSVARTAATNVQFLSFVAAGNDGMFVGTITTGSHKCLGGRKIKLTLNDKVIDSGTTTADGSWALHFTKVEWSTPGWIRAEVARTSECAGAKKKFDVADLSR